MSDPKVSQAIADGRVPKEITADYLNETRDASAIAGILFVTVLTSIIVLGRLASRAFLMHRFGIDDALTFVSWVSLSSWRPIAGRSLHCSVASPGASLTI